ncbi:MAG: UDP-N-acetylglucosamine 2-epimerase (non-hydrolyzing) [Candidatus Eisenbacteria bacterium]|nr:UDP-N-acetylglucosamine 2-epimerase (non-hydrolyzing) [Candidatus Eisenbacteria bacterium]
MAARIHCIVGARPNLVKIAPLMRAFAHEEILDPRLIHTGQHYDVEMSRAFFEDLEIPDPDRNLEVGSGSHALQTARIMERYERVMEDDRPALLLVVGDVNSTIACSLVAAKRGVAVAHVEAGLRSFDRSMPEEINRVLTDQLSDLLFITAEEARGNLLREGIAQERIHFTGNVMIDALFDALPLAARRETPGRFGLAGRAYAVATIHRPSNVDQRESLAQVVTIFVDLAQRLPLVVPLHPRTQERLGSFDLLERLRAAPGVILAPALRYLEFQDLMRQARLVLTDSGGIQEETTVLGIPCLTLRANTERPITVTHGTNRLVGPDPAKVLAAADAVLAAPRLAEPPVLPGWDGLAAQRIAKILAAELAA